MPLDFHSPIQGWIGAEGANPPCAVDKEAGYAFGYNPAYELRAGAIAGATAFAFAGLDSVAPVQAFGAIFNPVAYVENVAGSALVGCASSVASGGSCGSGAAASAVSAGLAPLTNSLFPNARNSIGERIGGTIVQATVGGLASVAGGGRFANGAVTSGFQYLVALGSVGGDRRMDALGMGPEDTIPGIGPAIAAAEAVGTVAAATPTAADGTLDVGSQIGMLRDAAAGKGNFILGSASASDSARLGEAWVGPNYNTTSDGYLVSEDGLRQYRQPSTKPMWREVQSNFEQRYRPLGQWQSNAHLTITGP